MGRRRVASPPEPTDEPRRVYVLDTSVLLADPRSLFRFDEHEVVIPLVVLTELEGKRHHPELGWAARQALRTLERLRTDHGSLLRAMPATESGGTLRVEVNHADTAGLPHALRADSNDHRILAVARNLANEGSDVVVVTKDLPLRLKASIVGLAAEEYRNELATDTSWTGFVTLEVEGSWIDELYEQRVIDLPEARDLPCHTGLALTLGLAVGPGPRAPRQAAPPGAHRPLACSTCAAARPSNAWPSTCWPTPRSASCRSAATPAPARACWPWPPGSTPVLEQRTHKRVVVFRPIYAVGGQELGYLPGSESEKMLPWSAAVTDALESIMGPEIIEEVFDRDLLEVLPLTHIRGRSLTDSFVIIDEAQNLERTVLLTALSRLGTGSRVVLTHDVAQRDNLRVGRHDGVVSVIEAMRGHPLFAHITLTRSERSAIAALVTTLLDGPGF